MYITALKPLLCCALVYSSVLFTAKREWYTTTLNPKTCSSLSAGVPDGAEGGRWTPSARRNSEGPTDATRRCTFAGWRASAQAAPR
eukprot:766040-Pyramimonas_sp.AAC.1